MEIKCIFFILCTAHWYCAVARWLETSSLVGPVLMELDWHLPENTNMAEMALMPCAFHKGEQVHSELMKGFEDLLVHDNA